MSFLCLCVVCALPLSVKAREVVSFDFGWRTRLGLHAPPDPNKLWPLPDNTGPGLNPAEAQQDFDDSSWERVRLPHDGLVAEGPSNVTCPSGCSGRSYIPQSVMWYRKSFALPEDWLLTRNQTSMWIEFDGIFRATIVYLNGDIIVQNAQGYLGFEVPLSKVTKGTNILGVYVFMHLSEPRVFLIYMFVLSCSIICRSRYWRRNIQYTAFWLVV